jgi:hypothetical protein
MASRRATLLVEVVVTVLLVIVILAVIAKWSPSLGPTNGLTPPGSSIGTTTGGTTIIQKQDNF